MTRKIYSAVVAGAAVLAATAGATSANAASTTATARARVLQALTITREGDLDFGAIVADPTNTGTVTISAAGGRTCTGTGVFCSGTVRAAAFDLGGSNNEIVALSLPAATVTLNGSVSGSMTATLALSAATVTLDGTGDGDFTVGGTLNVGAAQPQGVYTGTFTVNADYQ